MKTEEILGRLTGVREIGPKQWNCFCPAHDDRNQRSLVVKENAGKTLVHCFAGCNHVDICKAVGIQESDLFPAGKETGIDLHLFASIKNIPVEFLRSLGVENGKKGEIIIPYYDMDGKEARPRKRYALAAKDGTIWYGEKEQKKVPYGIWRRQPEDKYLVIVEGETDCYSLWLSGIPAIGIPGATMQKIIQKEHISGYEKIFIIQETDEAGKEFIKRTTNRLKELHVDAKIIVVDMKPLEAKDPHAYYIKQNGQFLSNFIKAMKTAEGQQSAVDNDPKEEVPPPFNKIINELDGIEKTFLVTDKGIYVRKIAHKRIEYVEVLPQAVEIHGIYEDIATNDTFAGLSWPGRQIEVPVDCISFTAPISKLTQYGIFVNSLNSRLAVEYFGTALRACSKIISRASLNGWTERGFVLGKTLVRSDGSTNEISFVGESYIPSKEGSEDNWKAAITAYISDYEIAMRLGAAAVSPAIKILGVESHIHHCWGGSSCGKTLGSFIAASLFGNPKRLIEQWNQTRAGKETYFEEAGTLPSFLDECHQAKPEEVSETAYDFSNERGKGRGTMKNGEVRRAKSKTWGGVLLSTGEQKISELSNLGGVAARVEEIMRSPADTSKEAGLLATKTKNAMMANYGFAGGKIIQYISTNNDKIKRVFSEYMNALNGQITNEIQGRKLPYIAANLVGCYILQSIGVPMAREQELIKYCSGILEKDEPPEPTWRKALSFIRDLWISNQDNFDIKKDIPSWGGETIIPAKNTPIWGKYSESNGLASFIPTILKQKLVEAGFDASVLYMLAEKNVIIMGGNKITRTERISGRVARVISIILAYDDE